MRLKVDSDLAATCGSLRRNFAKGITMYGCHWHPGAKPGRVPCSPGRSTIGLHFQTLGHQRNTAYYLSRMPMLGH